MLVDDLQRAPRAPDLLALAPEPLLGVNALLRRPVFLVLLQTMLARFQKPRRAGVKLLKLPQIGWLLVYCGDQ